MNLSIVYKVTATVIGLVLILFYIAYLWHDREVLIANYESVNDTFYNQGSWTRDLFTHETYYDARIYLSILIILYLLTLCYVYVKPIKIRTRFTCFRLSPDLMFLLSVSIGFALYYGFKAPYAYDEVFSAFHFAENGLCIAWSHYPLPNNHVLYNVVNAFFSNTSGLDALLTGRVLSIIFFLLCVCMIYKIVSLYFRDRYLICGICLLGITCFPLMGFAFQARGYSMLCLAFLTQVYCLFAGLRNRLLWYQIALWIGMCVMPSYLYFWVAFSIYIFWDNREDLELLKEWLLTTWISGISILVFYTPLISFSGWKSLISNKYVALGTVTFKEFFMDFFNGNYWHGLANEWFALVLPKILSLSLVGVMILLLLFSKDNRLRALGKLILVLFLTILVMILCMKKVPFYRNLASLSSLVWIAFASSILHYTPMNRFKVLRVVFVLSVLAIRFDYFSKNFPNNLYYYDVVGTSNTHKDCLNSAPKSRCTILHDEAFYLASLNQNFEKYNPNISASGCVMIMPNDEVQLDSSKIIYQCGPYSWVMIQ